MDNLELDIILYSNENSIYNADADVLSQFVYSLKKKYPNMDINNYDGDEPLVGAAVEEVVKDSNFKNTSGHPLLIFNGVLMSIDEIPSLETVDQFLKSNSMI